MRQMVSFEALRAAIGCGRSKRAFRLWLWRQTRDRGFPAPVQVGGNTVQWYLDEIEAHLAALPRVGGARGPKPTQPPQASA